MRLDIQDVAPDTEGTSLGCLHNEQPDGPSTVIAWGWTWLPPRAFFGSHG